jgi:hypothetical protein
MSKTLSERQYKNLIRKSKQGWACYYKAEQMNHELHMSYMSSIKSLEAKMEERDQKLYEKDHIPDFVKNEITDLLKILKKEVECPICYEELKPDEIKFSSCGHKFCADCLSKINECAVCRKKIYKKNNNDNI